MILTLDPRRTTACHSTKADIENEKEVKATRPVKSPTSDLKVLVGETGVLRSA